jgi:hypothetical protein
MDEDTPTKPAREKPSQVPSWVTLGFALGALFVLALPRRAPVAPPPAPVIEVAPPGPAKPPEAPQVTTIEAVFSAWDQYAVWTNDTTEVALWDSGTKSFSDFYEVLRTANGYYFRSIPGFTREILTHGVADNSPLQFTETERQRQEWLDAIHKENWKALSAGAINALAPLPALTPIPVGKPADGK